MNGRSIYEIAKLVVKGAEALDGVIANTLFKKKLEAFINDRSAVETDQLKYLKDWCLQMHQENNKEYPYYSIACEIHNILEPKSFIKEIEAFIKDPSALETKELEPLKDWCLRRHQENNKEYPYYAIACEIRNLLEPKKSKKSA